MNEPFPERISTARLELRPVVIADSEWIFARYAQDIDVCRFMTWKPHERVETVREWLTELIPDLYAGHRAAWIILHEGQGIGMIEARYPNHACEIGYCIARSAWGQGFMTEVVTAIRDEAMKIEGVHRFWACADVENPASTRVMEKAGMEREGCLRRYINHPNLADNPRDVYLHAFVRPPRV